jgi:hypothetical protein
MQQQFSFWPSGAAVSSWPGLGATGHLSQYRTGIHGRDKPGHDGRTTVFGWLPTCDQIGIWAPLPLIVLRFVQSVGGNGARSVAIDLSHPLMEGGR